MPLYEYQCNECGEEFEKMMRFSEAAIIPDCPTCASQNTRKKLSRIAVHGSSLSSAGFSSSASNCSSRGGFS